MHSWPQTWVNWYVSKVELWNSHQTFMSINSAEEEVWFWLTKIIIAEITDRRVVKPLRTLSRNALTNTFRDELPCCAQWLALCGIFNPSMPITVSLALGDEVFLQSVLVRIHQESDIGLSAGGSIHGIIKALDHWRQIEVTATFHQAQVESWDQKHAIQIDQRNPWLIIYATFSIANDLAGVCTRPWWANQIALTSGRPPQLLLQFV